jgi:hypothetical protein
VFERWQTRESLLEFRGQGPGDDIRDRILSVDVAEYEVA